MPTFDDRDQQREPPGWEPEPLHAPLDLPRPRAPEPLPEDESGEGEAAGVVIIDLC